MIGVVIRVKNEGDSLKKCITMLRSQNIPTEIIVVDSNSSDNTMDVCNQYKCNVVQCCEPFSFGKALNLGIEQSKMDFVCLLSAHCFPVGNHFLFNMWSNFNDERVAGVYARQIPHQLTNPVEYRNFLHIYGFERIVQVKNPQFNNGASMIRKSVWNRIRFDDKVIAQEDILWAKHVIDKGYRIVYEPSSVVEHLHNEDVVHTISRYEKETRALKGMGYIEW